MQTHMQGVRKKLITESCWSHGAPAQSAVNTVIVVNENRYRHNPSTFNFHHRHDYNSLIFITFVILIWPTSDVDVFAKRKQAIALNSITLPGKAL